MTGGLHWLSNHAELDPESVDPARLEVIGAHHPAQPVAKAARKALMKHRNR